MRTVFIECGTTARSAFSTGIQRVVRNIAARAMQTSPSIGLECILVQYGSGGFRPLERGELKPAAHLAVHAGKKHLLRRIDERLGTLPGLGWYHSVRPGLKRLVAGHLAERRRRRSSPEPVLKSETGLPPILLLLDSTWDQGMWAAVDAFRAEGGHVCGVLYDLIPFTHPETCAEGTRVAHTTWWSEAPEHLDSVMCISAAVRNEFLAWQKREALPRSIPADRVGYFYLGSELSSEDPHIRLLTEGVPFFMTVGSLEPRKNHTTVLDAFERLWADGQDLRLAIVGSFGWKSEELVRRIDKHPELNKRLFLIRDANDRDLTALYSATAGVVLASLTEGFGLPIVEAFQRGTAVVCSDIPVFREVAGPGAHYFDPFSPASLAAAVLESYEEWRQCSRQPALRLDSRKWLSWQESTEQLLTRLKQIVEAAPSQAAPSAESHH